MSRHGMRRPVQFGIVELLPYGIPKVLNQLLDLDSFSVYLENVAKNPMDDDLSLGYGFLVALVLERLIDSFLLDPSLFGLQWNELVNRAHQTDTPFSEFPDKSDVGKVVRNLARMYRALLPVRTFHELRDVLIPVSKGLMPELLEWSEKHRFERGKDGDKDSERARDNLTIAFLSFVAQDLAYVHVALNNTFHRGRHFEPQFSRLPTMIGPQRFFDGFKLGMCYLWSSFLGLDTSSPMTRALMAAKDWDQYYLVFPLIRARAGDVAEERVSDVTSVIISPGKLFGKLRSSPAPRTGVKSRLDRIDEIFRKYEVRLVGETYTAEIATGFLTSLIGAMTYYPDRVRLFRFVHPSPAEGGNRYSYAIFHWVPVIMGDQSRWWLYFNFCDDYSPRGTSALGPIESFIQKHESRLELSTFRVGSIELLTYVMTRPDWSKSVMDQMTREHNNLGTLSGLRLLLANDRVEKGFAKGLVLELLAMTMAKGMGYDTRWRVKALGKEFDVLAHRSSSKEGDEFLVIECSTQFLPTDLDELEGKVRLVKSNSGLLRRSFIKRFPKSTNVHGWLVTTDSGYPRKTKHSKEIKVVDWDAIEKYFLGTKIGIPASLEELLTKREFGPYDILEPQSVISGVTPPPSGKGEGSRGPVMLLDGLRLSKKWPEIMMGNAKYAK